VLEADRLRAAHLVELVPDRLLRVDDLDHRLDDEVAIRELRERGRARRRLRAAFRVVLTELPALHQAREGAVDAREARVEQAP